MHLTGFVLALDNFRDIFGECLTAFVSTGQLECKNYGRKGRECKRITIYLTHPTTAPLQLLHFYCLVTTEASPMCVL